MAKINNCRNCTHARWYRNAAGAKQFGNYAECAFKVTVPVMPASMPVAILGVLERPRGVASYRNEPVDCPAWESEK